MSSDFLVSEVRITEHRSNDDLLTAGLGLVGLRGVPSQFADADFPTPEELRRRAIQTSWKGIADLGGLGGYGEIYGCTASIPGREYQAFAKIPGARSPHRVLLQVPDSFDFKARCILVTASSGSRGIYGAIALAGAWGLPHGCAVAYTDKGAGSGYFDTTSATGVALNGTRTVAGEQVLDFLPDAYTAESGIAIKHAHSGDNPEADWGQHVLQAAEFSLAALDLAFPHAAPFTQHNTRIIAVGLSNGGGAVLQAAGLDSGGLISGVVALAPNIYTPEQKGSRPLYDYATEASLLLPCALTNSRFDSLPLARTRNNLAPIWTARGASLQSAGFIGAHGPRAQSVEALERLHADGWNDEAIATAASTTTLDLWRALAATYASAYTRNGVGKMPCGFRFDVQDVSNKSRPSTHTERAAWWADANGIPPGNNISLNEALNAEPSDPTFAGLLCLRNLWTGTSALAASLQESIKKTSAQLPRKNLPVWVIHGREDGLLPINFTSDAYVAWLRANVCDVHYWPIAHAQHFDAFLALPVFGNRYVPLLPYGYAALDRMWLHLIEDKTLDTSDSPNAVARGTTHLDRRHLGLR